MYTCDFHDQLWLNVQGDDAEGYDSDDSTGKNSHLCGEFLN